MKKYLSYIVALTIILIGLSSCHTSAPRLDYKALAQASVRLGVDIELQDNHKLYIHASEWIGTPYREVATANVERTAPDWYRNCIKKFTTPVCREAQTGN